MTNIFQAALSCGVFLALTATPAVADDFADGIFQPRAGLYVAGTLGFAFDFDITSDDVFASSEEFEFSLDESVPVTFSVGSYLGPARIEFETGFLQTDFDRLNFPSGNFGVNGDTSYLTFMGNVFYDFPTPVQGLDIYLGAGLGVAIIEADGDFEGVINTVDGGGNIISSFDEIDETFSTFAYQFMVGASYEVVENVTLSAGYRIRLFSENTIDDDFNDENTLNFREHNISIVEIGLRISF